MALIQCKLGPIETVVGSDTYIFRFDDHGRAVAEVPNISHQLCFLSVEHYLVAPEICAAPEQTPVEAPLADVPAIPAPSSAVLPGAVLSRRGKRRQG